MPNTRPTRPLKTWRQTLGEMVGYGIAFWPGVILGAYLLDPQNPAMILVAAGVSGAIVGLSVRFALMHNPRLRPALRWMFPAPWLTGASTEPPRGRRRRR